jgi:hypothetical protein
MTADDDEFSEYLAESMEDSAFAQAYAGASTRASSRRDRAAWAMCNWILEHVATRWYRNWITGAIRYGLAAAARDEAEDRPSPGPRILPVRPHKGP